jgi:chaperonin cofactor prefoldin
VIDTSGNVGVGTNAPSTLLEAKGEIKSSGAASALTFVNTANQAVSWKWNADASGAHFSDSVGNATNALFVAANGRVGIGTATPAAKLEVAGGIKCVGAVDTSSDARFKLNIQPLSDALVQTLRLRGVSYDWNRAKFPNKGFDDRHQLGFIAQEVREILPDVVSEDADGYLSIGYTAIIPVLAEAVKELKQQKDAEIAALAQKVTALEARDAAREARLTKLESALDERPARAITASLDLK